MHPPITQRCEAVGAPDLGQCVYERGHDGPHGAEFEDGLVHFIGQLFGSRELLTRLMAERKGAP